MDFLVFVLFIMSTILMINSKFCFKSITIASNNSATIYWQSSSLATFTKHNEVDGRPTYASNKNDNTLYYSETGQHWRVGKPRGGYVGIISEKCTEYICPSDVKKWTYYYKDNYGQEIWDVDSTLTVTCNQEQTNDTTAQSTTEGVSKTVIIGSSIGGGAGFLIIVGIFAFCAWRIWKSRQSDPENLDDNPVYGVYGDVYKECEIYDRNAYYAATDMEDTDTTMIRDNNSEYE